MPKTPPKEHAQRPNFLPWTHLLMVPQFLSGATGLGPSHQQVQLRKIQNQNYGRNDVFI